MRANGLVTIGTDPEFFFVQNNNPLDPIPAKQFLKGSVKDRRNRMGYDNLLGEIQPYESSCLQEVNGNIGELMSTIVRELLPSDVSLSFVPALEFDPKYSDAPEGQEFGCSPAKRYEAGQTAEVRPFVSATSTRFRTSGYHVHIGSSDFDGESGYDSYLATAEDDGPDMYSYNPCDEALVVGRLLYTDEGNVRLVQILDLIAGVWGVLMDPDPRNALRRQLIGYGRAGEFRKQQWGIEYRVLSGWPLVTPYLTWWANGIVRDCVTIAMHDTLTERLLEQVDRSAVETAINENSFEMAKTIWSEVKSILYRRGTSLLLNSDANNSVLFGATNVAFMEYAASHGGYDSFVRDHSGCAWEECDAYNIGFPSFAGNQRRLSPSFRSFCQDAARSTTHSCIK